MNSLRGAISQLFLLLLLFIEIIGSGGYTFLRFHEESEARNLIARQDFTTVNSKEEYDTVTLENLMRNYRHGPHNEVYMYFQHDAIAAYVGPAPKGHPNENDAPLSSNGIVRAWAMFDGKSKRFCDLDSIHDWGQLAIFSCPVAGLYRAYAIEWKMEGIPAPDRIGLKGSKKFVLAWNSRYQKEHFSLLTGHHPSVNIFNIPNSNENVFGTEDRMMALEHWAADKVYDFVDSNGNTAKLSPVPLAVSDAVLVKETYYCYYWMYHLHEVAREGYNQKEVIGTIKTADGDTDKNLRWTAHIVLELAIWIAEPAAVGAYEVVDSSSRIEVSDYSKVLTRRFAGMGLFPCLRKAHGSIEVISKVEYVAETDPKGYLPETPHWRVQIKIHTDRLISTLSDVTFTIASRQNTAAFNCFVGDTRVLYALRDFQFVPVRKLQTDHVNLNVSMLYPGIIHDFKFGMHHVYGHDVHHVGFKGNKKYQPASNRADMMVVTNPCIAQEFAFSVGGSLYVARGLLRTGPQHAKKVALPFFPLSRNSVINEPSWNDFLRIFDVAFTPTHLAFLMAEGYVMLHSSSAKHKGLAEVSETMKYRPDSFVKRRWCSRTASPKLSAQVLPIFGESGNIIILQIFPTEGNVPMWIVSPPPSCLPEGVGYTKKKHEQIHQLINETDIHYKDFAAVSRTNHKTGLREPPVPARPPPPPPPARDIYQETAFILDSFRNFVVEGEDPHFPHQLIDPASQELERNLENYNRAKIYVLENKGGLERRLVENGLLTISEVRIAAMEFTTAEKQFVLTTTFKADEVTDAFPASVNPPFQAIISTLTVTNFPYGVKRISNTSNAVRDITDEKLSTVIPFPGVILVRLKHYYVNTTLSRDAIENKEHAKDLQGNLQVSFIPEIFILGTAVPSYVVNLGNVLMFSSVENRYARPLHYYSWDVLDAAEKNAGLNNSKTQRPLFFNDSGIKIGDINRLSDVVVTEQGLISVLRRKVTRHIVQDDEICAVTPDTETQRVIMGSVIPLEGLRELKPFFRNDNIFQQITPDGEIIYGVYDVKPRSSFQSCPPNTTFNDTIDDLEPCIQQATKSLSSTLIPVCTKEHGGYDQPCRDPGYVEYCNANDTDPTHACFRINNGCHSTNRYPEPFTTPNITDPSKCDYVHKDLTTCLPKHAPREDIRTVNIIGTSYQSYLQGSLQSVRTMHPEASSVDGEWEKEVEGEQDICPFVKFELHHKNLDFAEVGYLIRVTAQVSYIGTGIPPEADIIVEYLRVSGIVVEVTTSVEEVRQSTIIEKAVDIHFHMPDHKLNEIMEVDAADKHHQRTMGHDFEDVRAREKFSVFSITFRPSIVNTRCKSNELFKTIQYNVGCNPFSNIRLMSEATALKRINWTETLDEQSGFQWHRDYIHWNLTIPKVHIFYKQLKNRVFKCDKNPSFCEIPYFHLFKNDIFTISYRDYFLPKFEQFLTVSSRPVTGNVVLYDLLGSKQFNWTLNKYKAGCKHLANLWYEKLLHGTKDINKETFEHENVYLYYRDCFDITETEDVENTESSQRLLSDPFYFFNTTNKNSLKFHRNRNEIFIFRAVVMNTYYNRFTYCKHLDTFFLVRVTGIPIPRQGLGLWQYLLTISLVFLAFVIWYFIFGRFYTWTVTRH